MILDNNLKLEEDVRADEIKLIQVWVGPNDNVLKEKYLNNTRNFIHAILKSGYKCTPCIKRFPYIENNNYYLSMLNASMRLALTIMMGGPGLLQKILITYKENGQWQGVIYHELRDNGSNGNSFDFSSNRFGLGLNARL